MTPSDEPISAPAADATRIAAGEPALTGPEIEERDPAGVGSPGGTPYTAYFPSADGYLAADLTHPAALPCVGDRVDYVDETGRVHAFRVREVVHVLQAAPGLRPPVGYARTDADPGDEEPAQGGGAAAEETSARRIPEAPAVRSGLPKVFLEPAEEE